jgi:hypothetical protein
MTTTVTSNDAKFTTSFATATLVVSWEAYGSVANFRKQAEPTLTLVKTGELGRFCDPNRITLWTGSGHRVLEILPDSGPSLSRWHANMCVKCSVGSPCADTTTSNLDQS